MKFITIATLLTFSYSIFANDARELTSQEKVLINKAACKAFANVYGNYLKIDSELCRNKSTFKIRENDPQYGTYIFGKLHYGYGNFKTCNMSIVNKKIADIDCGDE